MRLSLSCCSTIEEENPLVSARSLIGARRCVVNRRTLLAVLISLTAACDQATSPTSPVAPSTTTPKDDISGAVGGGIAYTGQAIALNATILGLNHRICDTGVRQGGQGAITKSVATYSVPGKLLVKLLYCETNGKPFRSASEAGVAEVILTIGGNVIFADLISSMAQAACPSGVSGAGNYTVNGHSFLSRLIINGKAHNVGKAPNTRIPLPNGYIVVNEQSSFITTFHAGKTVTALRIVINFPVPIANVAVATSLAHIDCP